MYVYRLDLFNIYCVIVVIKGLQVMMKTSLPFGNGTTI
jgi:hypothetical protein